MVREERRRFPRYSAPESFTAAARFPSKRELSLHLKYISIDGLTFLTEPNISGESFFNLSLEMTEPDGRSIRIETPAKIIWHTFDKETSRYIFGAQFLGLENADRECLQRILSSLAPEEGP